MALKWMAERPGKSVGIGRRRGSRVDECKRDKFVLVGLVQVVGEGRRREQYSVRLCADSCGDRARASSSRISSARRLGGRARARMDLSTALVPIA